jgi:peptidoglycan/xylan/chitin deacetylase (PgdA/CDA1 family)
MRSPSRTAKPENATMPQAFAWPHGHRVAVIVALLFENWSDGKAPSYSPMTTPLKSGAYDRAGVTWQRYGGHAGLLRLVRILDEAGIKATICANARSIELFPDVARIALARGHELAAHNYTQDGLLVDMTPKEQVATIRRCKAIFKDKLGITPTGWLSSVLAATDDTMEQVCAEGFDWYGDVNDWDLPRIHRFGKRSIVALPHSDFADNRVLRLDPRTYFNVYQDTFDYVYRSEPGSLINLTAHANFGGRSLIATQFARILEYYRSFPDVWFPRHDEMAIWFRSLGVDEVSYADRFFPAGAASARKTSRGAR